MCCGVAIVESEFYMRIRPGAFLQGRTTTLREACCLLPPPAYSVWSRRVNAAGPGAIFSLPLSCSAEDPTPRAKYGSELSAGASKRKREDLGIKVNNLFRMSCPTIDSSRNCFSMSWALQQPNGKPRLIFRGFVQRRLGSFKRYQKRHAKIMLGLIWGIYMCRFVQSIKLPSSSRDPARPSTWNRSPDHSIQLLSKFGTRKQSTTVPCER